MKASVIVFPGSNCDRDVAITLEQVIGSAPNMVWHREHDVPNSDLIVLPGGFSYGDYLRSGAMAAHSPIMNDVIKKAQSGTPVLGICNGFQMLTETGLLPGVLLRNASLKFICKDVHLKVERKDTAFSERYANRSVIKVPIAHHDGNYFADTDTLERLENENRIAFRYCTEEGDISNDSNPNGSLNNIAGIYNETGKILGLMPHPERLADNELGGQDGRLLFTSLAETLQ
ncbi:MAG: phosphoribosylformylglycinamidine synthase subunit PurQ [Pseudomonadota bacterium]